MAVVGGQDVLCLEVFVFERKGHRGSQCSPADNSQSPEAALTCDLPSVQEGI